MESFPLVPQGHLEVVKCLLNNSDSLTVAALIPLQTKNGNTCFHITCQEGFTHIMELLWFHPDVPKEEMVACQDKDGYNCLNDACYYGHLPLLEFFFNHWPKDAEVGHTAAQNVRKPHKGGGSVGEGEGRDSRWDLCVTKRFVGTRGNRKT